MLATSILASTAYAQDTTAARTFANSVFTTIVDPLIVLLFAVAVVTFIYGMIKFINSTDNLTERENGKRTMVYGIIGFFIMVSAFGIVRLIANTLGVEGDTSQYLNR